MKLIALAVLSTTTIAAAAPRHDLELAQVSGRPVARQIVPPSSKPAGTSALADSRIIYLDKNGLTVHRGNVNDARLDQSTIPQGDATIPAWNVSPTVWNDTVACVREMFSRFEVEVVETNPGNVPHIEGVFGGSPELLGLPTNTASVSPFAADCSVIENSMVFVFTSAIPQDARTACEVMTQAIGHSYGLDNELLAADPMSDLPFTGARSFQDQAVACGESTPRVCGISGSTCRPDQNSFRLLLARIGNNDLTPPDVIITSPADGEYVQPGFKVVATATDNLEVVSVTLLIDDVSAGVVTSSPYEFTTSSTLEDGQHFVKVVASDGKNQASYFTYVTVKRDDPPGTSDDDSGCAAGGGGSIVGFALWVMLMTVRLARRR